MKLRNLLQILAISSGTLFLGACASNYTASPGFGMAGYSSRDIDPTTVEVRYLSGAVAGTEILKEYVLYRSASIAIERGYDAFRIIDSGAYSVRSQHGYTSTATATIKMFRRDKEEDPMGKKIQTTIFWPQEFNKAAVYMASEVKSSLEKNIRKD
ncbi:CC0125/CC1285 family lipoprotein [Undibacterium terreum]|uniref:Lipoprotein n=1 Tax=Undibacterium terreum TaxID=1224302 RepID=A0A916UY32_9BURK|nr:hypothetical protein [Undibacterium terreum]GGC93394.1 hypothetical protein GCM10011396_45840 [Undibacterium terreum]